MLAIRIPPDIENRLQQLAKKTGRTKSYYAREAILRLIEDMEDEHLALSRLDTPVKRWTFDELDHDIDLEGLQNIPEHTIRPKNNNFSRKLLMFFKKIGHILQILHMKKRSKTLTTLSYGPCLI
jgi:RHH-type rel operon transcriptional repressor/antitoxin RelB